MLTEELKAEIKALIEERIAELEANVETLRERVQPVEPDVAIGRLSRTDSMINAGTAGLALKDAQNKLTRLRNRLERIDDPAFNQCSLCNTELTPERLRAAPDRGVCAKCLQKK